MQLKIINGEVLQNDELQRLDIVIEDGKIVRLSADGQFPETQQTINAAGLTVLPGVIDTHIHARDPGYTEKEDLYTASVACAAGGITMFIDMPNTNPPPDSLERFIEHREIAESKSVVNFNHWAMPTKRAEIPKIAAAGAIGFKFFMKSAHYPYGSDVSIINDGEILETIRAIAEVDRWCVVHPHNQDIWEYKTAEWTRAGRTAVMDWNSVTYGDSDVIETTPIALLAIMADAVGAKLRVLHVHGGPQTRVVRMLKGAGYKLVAETNPWGVFRIDPIGNRAPGTVEATWEAMRDGTIDLIGSDHAPHTAQEQEEVSENSFQSVIAAYPLAEHWLSMYLTEVANGHLTLGQLMRLASENVARHLGLYPAKGTIRVGSDADLVLVDLNAEGTLGETVPVRSKMGFTPLKGYKVRGLPQYTIVGGTVVMDHGEILVKPGFGSFVGAS